MRKTQKFCAAYIRVSTHDQEEYSPESQIKLIREYVKKNGYILPEEFIFRDDGISGRKAEKRPGFMQMIATAKQKPQPFQTILVWKFSRFARNQEESVVYKSLLKKESGIDVVSISEPLMEGPFGDLIERIIEWFDDFYSSNLGVEVRRGMAERASRGLPVSTAPLGYTYNNKALEIVPAEAETVQMIYRDFLRGASIISIAKKLNSMGIRTKRGGTWENRTVRYILTNPIYAGKLRWCTEGQNDYHRGSRLPGTILVDGEHPPIIAVGEFESVQEVLAKYILKYKGGSKIGQRENVSRMLQGIVKCSACGGTLSYTGAGMNCSAYIHGRCQVSHYVGLQKLELLALKAIEDQMRSLNLNIILHSMPDAELERARLKQLIKREENILVRFKEAYAAGVDTLEEYKENKAACESRIARITNELAGLSSVPNIDPEDFARKHHDAVEALAKGDLTPQEKNKILRGFIDHMVFHKDTKTIDVVYHV